MSWMFEAVMLAWTSIIVILLFTENILIPAILAGLQAIVLSVVFVLRVLNII